GVGGGGGPAAMRGGGERERGAGRGGARRRAVDQGVAAGGDVEPRGARGDRGPALDRVADHGADQRRLEEGTLDRRERRAGEDDGPIRDSIDVDPERQPQEPRDDRVARPAGPLPL